MTDPLHDLTLAMAVDPAEGREGVFLATFDEVWKMGRGTYGGLVFAAFARAFEAHRGERRADRPLRVFACEMCAPVPAATNEIHVETLREGNSVSVMAAKMFHEGDLVAHATGTFAGRRATDSDRTTATMPELPPAGDVPDIPANPFMPRFAAQLRFQFALGGAPFSGAEGDMSGGWISERRMTGPRDEAWLLAMLDAWWPPPLTWQTGPRPFATVSFHAHLFESPPTEGAVACVASTDHLHDGYAEEVDELWSADGRLLARARQVVAVVR